MPDIQSMVRQRVRDIPVMLRGYDQREVDEFFARVEAGLAGGRAVTAEAVRQTSFTVVMRGYECQAVDERMLRYVRELERRERYSSGQWRVVRTAT
jgi:DivIVA domain-containing protein